MAIAFSRIPADTRTVGVAAEFNKSIALQGLAQHPQNALLIGQRTSTGTITSGVLTAVTSDGLADGFFGAGSQLARMCKIFKENNPNTELWAIPLDDAGAAVVASGSVKITGSATANGTLHLMVAGIPIEVAVASGDTGISICSGIRTAVSANTLLPVVVTSADSTMVGFYAKNKGEVGNDINITYNYYDGQFLPSGITVSLGAMSTGATNPDLDDVWPIIDGLTFNYIATPYNDSANLTSVEDEMETREGPMGNLDGLSFTAYRGSLAACSAKGNARNGYLNYMPGFYNSPSGPEEWAAAWCAVAAFNLSNGPARPLHGLQLKGILPPPRGDEFTQTERNTLLYDGIATWVAPGDGRVYIERSISTYQKDWLGIPDPTWLDIQTPATLFEVRYQYKVRMILRYIDPRYTLVGDTEYIPPGSFMVRPMDVHAEAIALFRLLQDKGLVEDMEFFKTNLVTERDSSDPSRVNQLLPINLSNQFRLLAGRIDFIV